MEKKAAEEKENEMKERKVEFNLKKNYAVAGLRHFCERMIPSKPKYSGTREGQ